ncbi:MAG TPA: hypothetical protein VMQ62_07450, partial [Dongiaceae bacterium]|nr:hypothetical protein [Dongiaceae bacterium]
MTASRLAARPALWVAFLAPVAVVLVPPESAPAGRLVLALVAAASVLVLGLGRDATPGDVDLRGAASLLLPLALAAVLTAPARARAIDEAVLFTTLLLAAFVGRSALAEPRAAERFAALLAILGGAASLLAVA